MKTLPGPSRSKFHSKLNSKVYQLIAFIYSTDIYYSPIRLTSDGNMVGGSTVGVMLDGSWDSCTCKHFATLACEFCHHAKEGKSRFADIIDDFRAVKFDSLNEWISSGGRPFCLCRIAHGLYG